jgi:chromosome segregation ATPase
MSASAEALALLALVADTGRFSEKVQELTSRTEAANKATLDLQAAEKTSADKLSATAALLASLQSQAESLEAANAEAAAKIEAAKNDLARREAELLELKQQHVDKVEHDLRNIAAREEGVARKEVELGAIAEARAQDLRAKQDGLAAHHLALRTTVMEARKGIAVIAA